MEKDTVSLRQATPLPDREGQEGVSVDSLGLVGDEPVASVGFVEAPDPLDTLILETLERRALIADLDRTIIADVRRQARRAWIRRWARVVAFSFGLPLVLLAFFVCLLYYIKDHDVSTPILVMMVLPTLALIYSTNHAFKTFSPDEV